MVGRVLVFGSIHTDLVTYVDRLPYPGETVTGGRFEMHPGGKGANQAVAAARVGAAVELFGCIGDDPLGQERLASLQGAGVSTRGVRVRAGIHTGIAQIIVDRRGENVIAVASGANSLFTPADVTMPPLPEDETVVALFQNEVPQASTEALIGKCKGQGMTVLWNAAPAPLTQPGSATLSSVDCLICNEPELKALAGEGDAETLARELLQMGVSSVLVTLGERGCLLATPAEVHRQPAFPVTVVDTVGTGDCFCGVFAAALSRRAPVAGALREASAAAALSASVRGAQTSMPTAEQVGKFLSASAAHDL
jgi:ribokinase